MLLKKTEDEKDLFYDINGNTVEETSFYSPEMSCFAHDLYEMCREVIDQTAIGPILLKIRSGAGTTPKPPTECDINKPKCNPEEIQ